MELHRPARFVRAARRRAMVQQAVKKQAVPSLHWHGQAAADLHIGITDLPIAPCPMNDWSFEVSAGNDHHAAVFRQGLVERDPGADNGCVS